jgi:hypothetical protein
MANAVLLQHTAHGRLLPAAKQHLCPITDFSGTNSSPCVHAGAAQVSVLYAVCDWKLQTTPAWLQDSKQPVGHGSTGLEMHVSRCSTGLEMHVSRCS